MQLPEEKTKQVDSHIKVIIRKAKKCSEIFSVLIEM